MAQIPYDKASRAPQGVRGLKFNVRLCAGLKILRRAPQGVRGLKYPLFEKHIAIYIVVPRKGYVD